MEIKLNKDAYTKLIKEDMEKVEKYFPEHSLVKKHIQEVLKCSIDCYYPSDGKCELDTDSNCNITLVSNSLPKTWYQVRNMAKDLTGAGFKVWWERNFLGYDC